MGATALGISSVEVAVFGAGQEGCPFGRREEEGWAGGVGGVLVFGRVSMA